MKYQQLVSMPSAISDWLEEQLEARGIDAVIYTRYVLSLLHSNAVDIISPDDDLTYSCLRKEAKNSGNRKNYRSLGNWNYGEPDNEKLKRLAVIECLSSASDQNCEVESLVDELCEKLKEVEAGNTEPTQTFGADFRQTLTPHELARQYYAAFPPLCQDAVSPSKLIALVPKWLPSSKKKNVKSQKGGNEKKLRSMLESADHFMKAKRQVRYRKKDAVKPRNVDVISDWDRSKDIKNMINSGDQRIDTNSDYFTDDDSNMYEDYLLVDIMDLLDSPTPQKSRSHISQKELEKKFISSGTNITSSIWSDRSSNMVQNNSDVLDLQFSSISIVEPNAWSFNDPSFRKKGKTDNDFDLASKRQLISLSLRKLNHCKETSSFAECAPSVKQSYELFNQSFYENVAIVKNCFKTETENEKEDLLTSASSHFQPINPCSNDNKVPGQYLDGSTFVISSKLNTINYKRSESGFMCMELEQGNVKKYAEYKSDVNLTPENKFIVKFDVIQNNKACQVDLTENQEEIEDAENKDYVITDMDYSLGNCYDQTEAWKLNNCDKCNNNNASWNDNWIQYANADSKWNNKSLRNIWNGGEICHACIAARQEQPLSLNSQRAQLIQDVTEDGEQLLLDLNSLQKSYNDCLPAVELTCDIDVLLPPDAKRRSSFIGRNANIGDLNEEAWSFASRLEEDCLIQLSALPTLRSVTL